MSYTLLLELIQATGETLFMVLASGFFACLAGIPIAVLLQITKPNHLMPNPTLQTILSIVVNVLRSIPFIILMIAILPFTRLIIGTSIGTVAAIVPLTLSAIPFVARVVESALMEVPNSLIDTGNALGATHRQIITKILLPEALPGIIQAITVMLITLVGYSAMAGAIGAGGLGDLAINYGYQRFDTAVMIWTIIVLVIMVQLFQMIGDRLSRFFLH